MLRAVQWAEVLQPYRSSGDRSSKVPALQVAQPRIVCRFRLWTLQRISGKIFLMEIVFETNFWKSLLLR